MDTVIGLLFAVLTIVPVWKIFQRTGQNPALSLLLVVPVIGPPIVALIFGRGHWPNLPDTESS